MSRKVEQDEGGGLGAAAPSGVIFGWWIGEADGVDPLPGPRPERGGA